MSTSSDKQDPVLEARELLAQIPKAEYVVPEKDAAEHWHTLILRMEFVVGSLICVQVVPYAVGYVPTAKAFATMPATLRSLCDELEQLREETLKGICVYCGHIEQYESLEQKSGDEGNRMRVEHIKQCPERPELKLIAYCETLQDALRQFVHWYAEDSTEENRDNAYDAAVAALAPKKANP